MNDNRKPAPLPTVCLPLLSGQKRTLNGRWEMISGNDEAFREAVVPSSWLNALEVMVPTTAQEALVAAGVIPDPRLERNNERLTDFHDVAWWFRRTFILDAGMACAERIFLRCSGVEYESRIWLNGQALGFHEGMFGGPMLDITGLVRREGENEIMIATAAPPIPPVDLSDNSICAHYRKKSLFLSSAANESEGRIIRRYNDITSCGWAYPRAFTCGIWDDVDLIATGRIRLLDRWVFTRSVDSDLRRADVVVRLRMQSPERTEALRLRLRICGPDGQLLGVVEKEIVLPMGELEIEEVLTLANPPLWWPSGLGPQNLSTCVIALLLPDGSVAVDESMRFGIREITRRQRVGKPTLYPWLFSVNGREFFVRGFNWTPQDSLRAFSEQRYRQLLEGVAHCNANFLRVWGWGGAETEVFYDLCDELGILVSQEFQVTLGKVDDENLDVLKQQAEWLVLRLRGRTCLAQWSGGNELHNLHPGPVTAPLDFLENLVPLLDPTRIHQRTSPYGGDVHYGALQYDDALNTSESVPIWTRGDPVEVVPEEQEGFTPYGGDYFEWINTGLEFEEAVPANFAFVSETVYPTVQHASSIRKYTATNELDLPVEDLQNLGKSHPIIRHHADHQSDWFPYISGKACELEPLEGRPLGSLLTTLQYPQAAMYQYLAGGYRAGFPFCGGFLFWVFNTPWPIATWEVMDYYGSPNMAYFWVRKAFARQAPVARFNSFYHAPGECLVIRAGVNSDFPDELAGSVCEVTVLDTHAEVVEKRSVPLEGIRSADLSSLCRIEIPCTDAHVPHLFVVVEIKRCMRIQASVSYWLKVHPRIAEPELRRKLNQGATAGLLVELPRLCDTLAAWSQDVTMECYTSSGGRPHVRVFNRGTHPAFMVGIETTDASLDIPNDNYFWLWPGQAREVGFLVGGDAPERLSVSSWTGGSKDHQASDWSSSRMEKSAPQTVSSDAP